MTPIDKKLIDFYPRPPRGGRHAKYEVPSQPVKFLSTPSARRATRQGCWYVDCRCISIHALREEGDCLFAPMTFKILYFYPRPPRGGRPVHHRIDRVVIDISIHALREEGDGRRGALLVANGISIHALREEGDPELHNSSYEKQYFYPRPPRGGRRQHCHYQHRNAQISIHALREEGDDIVQNKLKSRQHFYPRPPRGGRQQKQRENPLLLSHYTPPCTNCKEVPVKQTAKSHRYLRKRLVFRCEASGKTMCAACSHWRGIKRSAHYPAQTPGAAQHARP